MLLSDSIGFNPKKTPRLLSSAGFSFYIITDPRDNGSKFERGARGANPTHIQFVLSSFALIILKGSVLVLNFPLILD